MKSFTVKLFKFIAICAFVFAIPAFAQSKAKTDSDKKAVLQKTGLTKSEKKELKAAQEILKVMKTYHKGKFTRLFNAGSKAELMALPDVGEKTAERIIAARPHESSAHVVLVKGIGLETYKKWVDAKK